jgi:transposase
MRGRSHRTSTREAKFLAALAAGWSVTKAAEAIGIARRTAYDWRDTGEDFARRWTTRSKTAPI